MSSFSELGIDLKGKTKGQVKVLCPKCSHTRHKNRGEPCLSVNIDEGIYNCHHCEFAGTIKRTAFEKKVYVIPKYNNTPLSDKNLAYFKSRGISQSTLLKHKVTEELVFVPKDGTNVPCVVFNYFKNGQLVNKKYRSENKGFKMESGAELVFYNVDTIQGSQIIITEGEVDCLSFDEAGFQNVTSVPNGANLKSNNMQYLESAFDCFKEIKKIYIATDADEAGVSLMLELSRRLGHDKCYIVKYPDGCKDGNDVLVKHGVTGLKQCIADAEPFPIEGVVRAKDTYDGILRLYRNGMSRGVELQELGTHFTEMCTFKTSMLYLVTGIPSHGKSSFVNYCEMLLAVRSGWKWGVFSPEHYPLEYLVYKYAELLIGSPFFHRKDATRMNEFTLDAAIKFVHEHFFFIRPEGEDFTLDKILEAGRQLVFRHGIKGFTIDPWNSIAHDFSGMTETQYIERSLNKLTAFKQVNDVALFLIAHPAKIQKNKNSGLHEVPTLYDVAGSANFFNKCDVGMVVYRNFSTEKTEVYIQKMKFRNIGAVGFSYFNYNPVNNRYNSIADAMRFDSLLEVPVQGAIDFDEEENWVTQMGIKIDDDTMPF